MKNLIVILSVCGLLFGLGCNGGENNAQRGEDATAPTVQGSDENPQTNTAMPSDPVPSGISHTPYQPANEDEFTELDGGVKLWFIEKGDGPVPSDLNQKVKAHYHGMLTDGKVFDSSFERGVPLEFPLAGVIRGWQVGLMNTPVGSKIKLEIPAEMAYGSIPRPGIPANSTLVFDVELLDLVN